MAKQHRPGHLAPQGWSGTTLRAVAASAAVLLAVSACGSKPSESASSGNSKDPIVVGISLPLTGDFSQPGGEARKGYEIWRDQVNAAGGLLGRKVQLKITDDASNQDTVVTDYTKLITQDKVDLLLGTFSTLLNFPASAVAEKNGMLYVEPAGGAPKMFDRGFKKLFFAQQATASHQPDVFVDYIKSLPADQRPKTAAYPTQDDPFTTPVIQSMQKQLEALGVQTVYTTTYPADATNFQTIASAIAAAKPDLIAQGAVFEDGVGLIRSLQQLNYSPKMMFQTSAPSNAGQYSDGIGVKNTEGIFYTVSWNEKAKTPGNDKFVAEYAKRYNGGIPAEDAADAYAAAQTLQAAVKKVGSLDQTKLADYLHKNEVDSILGPLAWDETGAPTKQFLLGQWQNGAPEIVAPKEAATVDKAVAKTPWQ
jgi:ABC-type branched-subunit amino acid transport system substrate-binding protein